MTDLITCRGLTKSYGGKTALNGVDLSVGSGRIVGLLGPNGSGKTTFIKLLCGLLQPTAGTLMVECQPIGSYTKSIISYLPDRLYFADWMTVQDLLDLFQSFYADFEMRRAVALCQALGVGTGERIKTMSKGAREKMQLALVMSRRAKLYLLDEPIGGVDPAARDYILSTILANHNENSTVLLATHLIGDVERVLDEAIFLKEGRVLLHDGVDIIREREGKSVDALFREVFRAAPERGGRI